MVTCAFPQKSFSDCCAARGTDTQLGKQISEAEKKVDKGSNLAADAESVVAAMAIKVGAVIPILLKSEKSLCQVASVDRLPKT